VFGEVAEPACHLVSVWLGWLHDLDVF